MAENAIIARHSEAGRDSQLEADLHCLKRLFFGGGAGGESESGIGRQGKAFRRTATSI